MIDSVTCVRCMRQGDSPGGVKGIGVHIGSPTHSILRRVLTKCSGQLHTGWEQMTVVYLGMGELVRELRRHDSQPSSAREHQFQQFAGQVMEEVGLQRWVTQQGGIRMVVS